MDILVRCSTREVLSRQPGWGSAARKNAPDGKASGARLVGVAGLGPLVGAPDGGVAIDVGTVLGVETEHAVALHDTDRVSG